MSVTYRLAKNYTLQIGGVVLAVSLVAVALWLVPTALPTEVQTTVVLLGLWLPILGSLGVLTGAWYVGEQIYKRRKFEKLIATDKRSDFTSARKDLEDLARGLPDSYKPRIAEKEASFRSRRA